MIMTFLALQWPRFNKSEVGGGNSDRYHQAPMNLQDSCQLQVCLKAGETCQCRVYTIGETIFLSHLVNHDSDMNFFVPAKAWNGMGRRSQGKPLSKGSFVYAYFPYDAIT